MKHKTLTTGLGLLIAALTLAGLTAAQPMALIAGEGGGAAEGQADAGYYADASDGLDKAYDAHNQASANVDNAVTNTNKITTETKWSAWHHATGVEAPTMPDCACQELFTQLEQAGNVQATHADQVHKAADLDTEVVDAGADLSAAAQAHAWAKDLTKGAADAYDEIRGVFGYETQAKDDVEHAGESTLTAEEQIRGELVHQLDTDHELPRLSPSLDGDMSAQHATSVATDAAGSATGTIG